MTASPGAIGAFELGIVLGILATATVALRFQARRETRTTLGADDYAVFVGLVFMLLFLVTSGMLVFNAGLGKHEVDLSALEDDLFGKVEFASELLYLFTMASAKISILLLYRRIFATRSFRIVTLIMGVVILAWCISSVLVTSFQCDPVAAAWNFHLTATCIDPVVFSLAIALTGVLTDFVVLFLPVHMIWKLHLPTRQKIVLSIVFLLGGFVCFASVMRIITLQALDNNDLPYTLLVSATWTLAEAELAVTCANLPLLRPIFPSKTKFIWLQSFIRNSFTKLSGSDQSNTGNTSNSGQELESLRNSRPRKHGSRFGYHTRAGSSGSDERSITTVEESRNADTTWLKDSSSASLERTTPVV
ncbi:hypothetical protein MMC13_003009 [Lambiella insularis]|nr:hypothetical protein [Lambiella insularis]